MVKMSSSESGESMDSTHNRKHLKSVIQMKKNEEFVDLSRMSDDESDEDKENNERDWRKRKNTTSRNSNVSPKQKYSRHDRDDSEEFRRSDRYTREHRQPKHDYNREYDRESHRKRHKHSNYRDLDRPHSSDEETIDIPKKRTVRKNEPVENTDQVKSLKDNEQKDIEKKKKTIEDLFTKSGGAYIPPSKLRELQAGITDKTSTAYQRMAWEALKKSINGLVNKVNVSNIGHIVEELLQENIVRGRGLLAQSIIRAQVASPTFSNVYAALVSIINTKFPKIGELILRRLIIQFRRSFKRNDKRVCINSAKFIAHLVNQQVAHELLALEILTLLLQKPNGDSAEVAISFLKDVGQMLTDVSPRGINAVFERLRDLLHTDETEKRVQYMIEVMFAVRKDKFKDFISVGEGLDLVEEDDQITHLLRLDDSGSTEDLLNVFKHDPDFAANEEKYKQIRQDILGDSSDESGDEDDDDDDDDDEDEDGEEKEGEEASKMEIIDKTETNLVALRRLIYLTIQSSLDFEECAHKMMKLEIKPGQEHEFCLMVVECCSQQRSYEKFFGLLGQRFCLLKKEFMAQYVIIFQEQYETCHHLETNKLRNTSKFFAHLLHSDAIPWTVMECIRLNEDDTTSSSRIFIKILFQELAEYLGIKKFVIRLKDPIVAPYLEGIFPRDNPRDTRFAINFFTAIGLGGLTDELREHLKNMPKVSALAQQVAANEESSSSSSSSDSSSSDSSSSDSSSSDSSDSEADEQRKERSKKDSKRIKNLKDSQFSRTRDHGDDGERRSHDDEKRENYSRRRGENNDDRRRGNVEAGRKENDYERRRENDSDMKRKNHDDYERRREDDSDMRRENHDDYERRREKDSDRRRGNHDDYERKTENDSDRRRENHDDYERRRENDSDMRRENHDDYERRRENDSDTRRENHNDRRRGNNDESRNRYKKEIDYRKSYESDDENRTERKTYKSGNKDSNEYERSRDKNESREDTHRQEKRSHDKFKKSRGNDEKPRDKDKKSQRSRDYDDDSQKSRKNR